MRRAAVGHERPWRLLCGLACALMWLTGCADRLPTHQWVDGATALDIMSRRAAQLQTLTCQADLLLERDGRTVQLEAAIATRAGGYLRIRMWKFMRPVGDITSTPEGIWVVRDDQNGPSDPGDPGDALTLANGVHRAFTSIIGGPDRSLARVLDETSPRFTVVVEDGDATLHMEVDRDTLTVRRCLVVDDSDRVTAMLELDDYALFDSAIVLPRRLTGTSGADRFVIRTTNTRVNDALPAGAFTPPARAVRLAP